MRVEQIGDATLINGDCMDYMRGLPDKAFDLAIVDPPYGIEISSHHFHGKNKKRKYHEDGWDYKKPDNTYFENLIRVSKNTIIFGLNYFTLPLAQCVIVWDKGPCFYGRNFAEVELLWTTFPAPSRIYKENPQGYGKIHPTQKPVALYKWILSRYAKPGDRILDTHGGSGSQVVACIESGFPIVWIEKDEDYYADALVRIRRAWESRPRLFDDPKPDPKPQELDL